MIIVIILPNYIYIYFKIPDLSLTKYNDPVQPILLNYPRNNENRSFNSTFYTNFSWIEYSILKDMVYCFMCRHFTVNTVSCTESKFINKGFNCWRKQTESYKKHMYSEKHKLNYEKYTMFLNAKKMAL